MSQREAALRCGDPDEYWKLLNHDRSELDRLIDEVVVAESWFFRDGEPFDFLGEYVRKQLDHQSLPLRVLSVPCAQGQEPFSIAITLLESGLSPDSFEIDGVDLSPRLIRRAGRAPYRAAALRTLSEAWRERYFEPAENGQWVASEMLRDCVRFRSGNITSASFALNRTPYRIIFCRNLIIYLNPESRESLLRTLHGFLEDDGVLVVGHAEAAPTLLGTRFRPSERPGAFAFFKVRRESSSDEEGLEPLSSVRTESKSVRCGEDLEGWKDASRRSRRSTPRARDGTRAASLPKEPEDAPGLPHAQKLADAGHLKKAEQICRDHLRAHAQDCEAYYLLGAVLLAGGHRAEAEESFRRVVYLDPDHVEALLHLATLSNSRGDERGARGWRRRLERLAAGEGDDPRQDDS